MPRSDQGGIDLKLEAGHMDGTYTRAWVNGEEISGSVTALNLYVTASGPNTVQITYYVRSINYVDSKPQKELTSD